MSRLRKLAEGQPCAVRFHGCDGGGETTVLAHIRRAGIAGVGQKPPDLCGVYACAPCHSLIDGRTSLANVSRLEIDQGILFALLRTLVVVSKELRL